MTTIGTNILAPIAAHNSTQWTNYNWTLGRKLNPDKCFQNLLKQQCAGKGQYKYMRKDEYPGELEIPSADNQQNAPCSNALIHMKLSAPWVPPSHPMETTRPKYKN